MPRIVRIQPEVPEEEVAVVRLLSEVDAEFDPPLSSRTALADFVAKLLKHGRVVAACVGNDLAGMAGFYCNNFETRTGHFSILAVKSSFRKAGLGRLLVEAVLRESREAGMQSVRLETLADGEAVRFHERMGFHKLDAASNRPGGRGLIMEHAFEEPPAHGNSRTT